MRGSLKERFIQKYTADLARKSCYPSAVVGLRQYPIIDGKMILRGLSPIPAECRPSGSNHRGR
jgi:hypothetical protein